MAGTVVEGGAQLRELKVRLYEAGNVELWKATTKNIRIATAPARPAVRSSMRAGLPRAGRLNEWAAKSTVSTSVLTGRHTAGVVVRVKRQRHDMKDLDRGQLRHPLFGNRRYWYPQTVPAGTVSKPLIALSPAVLAACYAAMREAAATAGFH